MNIKSLFLATAALGCVAVSSAQAHVEASLGEVPAGSTSVIGFGVGHGCNGAATTLLRLSIPEGITSVEALDKPGWDIEVVEGDAGVTEVNWSGGSLPDGVHDEFSIRVGISEDVAPGTDLYFPAIQECENGGIYRWITISGDGEEEADEPAPSLRVVAPSNGEGAQ